MGPSTTANQRHTKKSVVCVYVQCKRTWNRQNPLISLSLSHPWTSDFSFSLDFSFRGGWWADEKYCVKVHRLRSQNKYKQRTVIIILRYSQSLFFHVLHPLSHLWPILSFLASLLQVFKRVFVFFFWEGLVWCNERSETDHRRHGTRINYDDILIVVCRTTLYCCFWHCPRLNESVAKWRHTSAGVGRENCASLFHFFNRRKTTLLLYLIPVKLSHYWLQSLFISRMYWLKIKETMY